MSFKMRLTDILFRETGRDPNTLRIDECRIEGDRQIIRYRYPLDWSKTVLTGIGTALMLYLAADSFIRKPSCIDYIGALTTGTVLNLAENSRNIRLEKPAQKGDIIEEGILAASRQSDADATQTDDTQADTAHEATIPTPTACPTSQQANTGDVQIMTTYEVQIAACRIRSNAERLYSAIVEENIDDVMLVEENIDLMPFYKVKLGSFQSVDRAVQCKNDLQERLSLVMEKFRIDDLTIVKKDIYMISISSSQGDDASGQFDEATEKGKFIEGLKRFMIETNSKYVAARYTTDADIKKHSLDQDSSEVWANAIYNMMDKYSLPPEFIKIFAHEGGFDPNALGDLKHKWGPSDGPAQILMESQLEIWQGLKKDGYQPPDGYAVRDILNDPHCKKTKARWIKANKKLPEDMPDIRADPNIYCEFAAKRFRECLDNQYVHAILNSEDYDVTSVDETEVIKNSVGAYNAGPRAWSTNKDGYTDKVYSVSVPSEVEKLAARINDGKFVK